MGCRVFYLLLFGLVFGGGDGSGGGGGGDSDGGDGGDGERGEGKREGLKERPERDLFLQLFPGGEVE